MSEPPGAGAGLPLVDVLVTVPAESRLDAAGRGAGPGTCFARHRVEWRGAELAADGRQTWHFRAPDAESVRIALRQAAIPFDAFRVARELDSTMES